MRIVIVLKHIIAPIVNASLSSLDVCSTFVLFYNRGGRGYYYCEPNSYVYRYTSYCLYCRFVLVLRLQRFGGPVSAIYCGTRLLASFCLGRHWVCALVVIPWSSCNGDCGCRAQSASGRSSCRSGTQRLCRPRYPMLPSLVCAASSSRVALSVSVLF